MKLLIAVLTCHRLDYFFDDNTIDWLTQRNMRSLDQQARVNAQRETWLSAEWFSQVHPGVTFDHKFFYGTRLRDTISKPNQRVATPQPSYLREPLSDEVFLPVQDNYTHNASKMKAICKYALENGYDYVLRVDDDTLVFPELFGSDWDQHPYSGAGNGPFHPGSCVFLSRESMQTLVAEKITSFADDLWIGQVLSNHGIPCHAIPGIRHEFGDNYLAKRWNGEVSLHSVTPELMRSIWTVRAMSLLQQQKVTAGATSKTTQSPSASLGSEDEKSSSSVTSPTLPEKFSLDLGLNLSTTSPLGITQSLSDSESSEIGLLQTSTQSDI